MNKKQFLLSLLLIQIVYPRDIFSLSASKFIILFGTLGSISATAFIGKSTEKMAESTKTDFQKNHPYGDAAAYVLQKTASCISYLALELGKTIEDQRKDSTSKTCIYTQLMPKDFPTNSTEKTIEHDEKDTLKNAEQAE